tara:strand:+ start:327 stop:581 length:255 start_codon:yes stop_codon:yes gene_type:complete
MLPTGRGDEPHVFSTKAKAFSQFGQQPTRLINGRSLFNAIFFLDICQDFGHAKDNTVTDFLVDALLYQRQDIGNDKNPINCINF